MQMVSGLQVLAARTQHIVLGTKVRSLRQPSEDSVVCIHIASASLIDTSVPQAHITDQHTSTRCAARPQTLQMLAGHVRIDGAHCYHCGKRSSASWRRGACPYGVGTDVPACSGGATAATSCCFYLAHRSRALGHGQRLECGNAHGGRGHSPRHASICRASTALACSRHSGFAAALCSAVHASTRGRAVPADARAADAAASHARLCAVRNGARHDACDTMAWHACNASTGPCAPATSSTSWSAASSGTMVRQLSVNAPLPVREPSNASGKQNVAAPPDSPAGELSVHSACTAQPSDSTVVAHPDLEHGADHAEADSEQHGSAKPDAPALSIEVHALDVEADCSDAPEQYQPSPLGELLPKLQLADEAAQSADMPVPAEPQAKGIAASVPCRSTVKPFTSGRLGTSSGVRPAAKPPGALCLADTNALVASAQACAAAAQQAAAASRAQGVPARAPAPPAGVTSEKRTRRSRRHKPYAARH